MKRRILILHSKKFFSSSANTSKVGQFFKPPKHKFEFHDKILENSSQDYSVLKSFKNQDEEIDRIDMMEKIIKKKTKETQEKAGDFFSNSNPREILKVSQNLIEKLRLNKEFRYDEEFKKKEVLSEYGNYDKYFENYKTVHEKAYDSNDDGHNPWERKFSELQEKFNSPNKDYIRGAKRIEEEIKKDISTYGAEFTFQDYLNAKKKELINERSQNLRLNQKVFEEYAEKVREQEAERKFREDSTVKRTKLEKDWDNQRNLYKVINDQVRREGWNTSKEEKLREILKNSPAHKLVGRVSPWCKEEIYRNYLEGWTVKDLSFKYGLLPERVKAIVWCRDYFWKEVYPKIGETGLKIRLAQSIEYAKKFGYIDYGKDLELMAWREQGIRTKKIERREMDCKPDKETEKKVSDVLKRLKPRAVDRVPTKFVGKGPSGYLIKDLIVRRGNGKRGVSRMFERYLHHKDFYPQILPNRVVEKKELGPRIATLGFRL